ncbi:oligosaccharide flippase family protein [Escherichia coli]|nr:oligosaccharide flippase family protein [Escherichia coli]
MNTTTQQKYSQKKELAYNFINLSLINVLNIIIPIISMPYLSRVLGASGYGLFFLYTSTIAFCIIIADYSSNISGVRLAAKHKNKPHLRHVYKKVQSTRALMSFAGVIIGSVYSYFFISEVSVQLSTAIILLSVFGYYLTSTWFHQGVSDIKVVAISSFISRTSQLILMFFL